MFIYILKLQHDCYYVGKSTNPSKRMCQHKNKRGSAWTRIHTPIRLMKKMRMTSALQEDQVTEELMKKKGIDKVRGGVYNQVNLPKHMKETLRAKLFHASDKCLICGSNNHFARNCRRTRQRERCVRCGRNSHTKSSCYAKTTVDGIDIISSSQESEEDEWECSHCPFTGTYEQVENHEIYCRRKRRRKNCARCGRDGHTKSSCYAKTTFDGDIIG